MIFSPNVFILGSAPYYDEPPRNVAYYAASQRLNSDEILFKSSVKGDRVYYIASTPDQFVKNSPSQSSPLFCLLDGSDDFMGDGTYVFENPDSFSVVIKHETSYSSFTGSQNECLEFIQDNQQNNKFHFFHRTQEEDQFDDSIIYSEISNSIKNAEFSEHSIAILKDKPGWEYLQFEELQKSFKTEKKLSLVIGLAGVLMIAGAISIYGMSALNQQNTFPQQVESFTSEVKKTAELTRSNNLFANYIRFEIGLKAKVHELGGWVDYITIEKLKGKDGAQLPPNLQNAYKVKWNVHINSWATPTQINALKLNRNIPEGGMVSGYGEEIWK